MVSKARTSHRHRKSASAFENSRWFIPIAFLILFLAMVFLFSDFVFSDQMLYGSDILQASGMFRIYQTQYMADHNLAVPQWDPHQFGGMPFVEAFHSDIFYPPSYIGKIILIWLGQTSAKDILRLLGWLLFLHIYFSGIFMYRAARQFKLARVPSLFAGASYMFAGYLVSFVAPGHDGKIFVAALFPLMMFLLDRGFEKERFLGKLRYFSLTGLTIGLILLTPHPQMSYFALWALTFLAAFRLITIWVQKKSIGPAIKPGLFVVYAVAAGVMVSAIQMYPGILYTQEYSPRADTKKGWDWATSWSMHQEEAASLVIPEFSGTSTEKAKTYYWGKNFFKDNSEWLGTVSLFLALIGLFFYRHRREAWFFGGLALFAILYGLGGTTPFFWIMFKLVPRVESMRAPSMIMFLASFSVALLAGMGIQSVLDTREQGMKTLEKKFHYFLFGFPAFMLLLAFGFSLAGRGMIRLWCTIFYSEASTEIVQQGVTKLDVAYMNLPAIQSGAWLAFFFVGITALVVWLSRQGKGAPALMLLLVALPVIDGVRFDSRFVKIVESRYFDYKYAEHGLTKFLAGQKERSRFLNISGPDEVKDADMPVHGVDVTVGYHGNQLRWYDDLLGGPNLTNVYPRFNVRLGNLTGTKFLIAATGNMPPPDHFGLLPLQKVADLGGGLQLLRNDNALPRVFTATEYQVIADRDAMLKAVLNGASDMRRVVLLEETPTLNIVSSEAVSDSAWIVDYQPESVVVGVTTSQHALLVLTDCWFPSWQVTVDGRPTSCLRAYGAFRAVEIPAGSREVRFEYYSSRYTLGRTVTWIALLCLLGVIGLATYGDRRTRTDRDTTEGETE